MHMGSSDDVWLSFALNKIFYSVFQLNITFLRLQKKIFKSQPAYFLTAFLLLDIFLYIDKLSKFLSLISKFLVFKFLSWSVNLYFFFWDLAWTWHWFIKIIFWFRVVKRKPLVLFHFFYRWFFIVYTFFYIYTELVYIYFVQKFNNRRIFFARIIGKIYCIKLLWL